MITVGIDLAAQDADTASCRIEWRDGRVKVRALDVGRTDSQLLDDVAGADKIAIDAPFGWPEPFWKAIGAHRDRRPWRGRGKEQIEFRRTLRLRTTDRVTADEVGVTPLSVSSDRIGVVSFRCALLLDLLAYSRRMKVDRSGVEGKLVEVYPAATLKRWELKPKRSYGKTEASDLRRDLAIKVAGAVDIKLSKTDVRRCAETSGGHAVDALIAAITARATALGWTRAPVNEQEMRLARTEGWIHFPEPECAGELRANSRGPGLRERHSPS